MYDRMIHDFKLLYPGFPSGPGPEIGLAIKHIRLRMGLTQDELARDAKIKLSALKTLENGYAKFTTASNLEAIARVLRVHPRDIVWEGREWYPGNFFILKSSSPENQVTDEKQTAGDETWFKRKRVTYNTFEMDFFSPPLIAPSYFCAGILDMRRGKTVSGLRLPHPGRVAGLVQRGTLKVAYDSKHEFHIFANQAFSLEGAKPHDFTNADKDNPLRICLVFPAEAGGEKKAKEEAKTKVASAGFSVGRAMAHIRRNYRGSPAGGGSAFGGESRPLTFSELSCLTGIDAKALRYLENTTRPEQVIYWDKIEKIASALDIPFTKMLDLMEGRSEGYFRIATAHDRALIDYHHYLGVRIKSAVFPEPGNRFHLSEAYIEPRGGIRRVSWKRTDHAHIGAYVEDGELLVEVGRNRKVSLKQGDSVYFDGSLGYMFTNPGTKPAKLFMATYPAIVF